jgi:hypothetical protein
MSKYLWDCLRMDKVASKSAVIITGNPKYIHGKDKDNYAKYYNDIENTLKGVGYTDITRDPGNEYTEPRKANLWVGHSRGVDRLRFAPKGTKTLKVDDYENPRRVGQRHPGAEHWTMTDSLRNALRKTAESKIQVSTK